MAKTITQLTDATSVSPADEMIVQQSGVTKRATVSELRQALSLADITPLSSNKTFSSSDTGKIYHFNTTAGNITATFSGATLPPGFNVTIVNIGTNNVILSADSLMSIGTTISEQYGSAFVYSFSGSIYATGRLV